MKTLGIDTHNCFLVYEGDTFCGYPIWPAPTLIAVSIVDENSNTLSPGKNQRDVLQMDYVFVDEGYDPTSRVRKGRLFVRYGNVQPHEWHVNPHPLDSNEQFVANASMATKGVIRKSLGTYCEFSLSAHLKTQGITRPLFLLGNNMEFTIWSLVDAEATVSGETLVYLKARRVFGALPRLNEHAVPEKFVTQVRDKLNTLAEDIHKAGVESVIDRAREAATAILSAYLQSEYQIDSGKDMAALANSFADKVKDKKSVTANLATVLARLHSRGKNAVQEKHSPRKLTEQDAELAVQSIGLILRDIGWAE